MIVVWLLLLILMMYVILRSSVARVTRTPVWLLWLVLISPITIWLVWLLIYHQQKPVPVELILGAMVVSSLVYWFLVQRGRQPPQTPEPKASVSPLPPAELPKKEVPSLIAPTEEETLRNCFPWSVFPLQKLEFRSQAVICRGQLRSQPEVAYQTIRHRIEERFGDRFLIMFQADSHNKPFFALVPNPYQAQNLVKTQAEPLNRPALAVALAIITLFTTTVVGARMAGVSLETWQAEPASLLQGLSYGMALIGILGSHELAHYWIASRHGMRSTLPYFMPVPFFLGTLGAFVQMRSPFPHRRAMFDVSVLGPWVGLIITLPVLAWGLAHSQIVTANPEKLGILDFDHLDPSFSFLLTVLSKLALGTNLTAAKAIDLHPVAIAGYLGLIVTAFNLLPLGQLDGGRMIHAMLGQQAGIFIGQITRICVLVLALARSEFWLLALLLFFLPLNDEPALNDITELDNGRDLIGLVTLGLLLVILLPMPGAVAQLLGY
ncbi:MAG: site-2 protease family protein [Oscillatoriales cyanobacterium RM2_1_1]|nr:site-2 protease family protein [Oscillatoriales cyanobacterium SM2_3_0]NJO46691.1 site-2 protease family protein [Oscillatoriales cyanobacterium RM2_1_1]